jgi:hypothetical protein
MKSRGNGLWYGIVALEVRYPVTHSIETKFVLMLNTTPVLCILGGHFGANRLLVNCREIKVIIPLYRVRINYRRISLRHNFSRKCLRS